MTAYLFNSAIADVRVANQRTRLTAAILTKGLRGLIFFGLGLCMGSDRVKSSLVNDEVWCVR